MLDSEIINVFDESRDEFKPYGLTCELWAPNLMRKPDRHHEIEINYFLEGSMTYLFQGSPITIPAKRLCLFWGLIPHQIIHYEGTEPYFVCTIPFSEFFSWKLPTPFVDSVLKGEVLLEASEKPSTHDEYLLHNWLEDLRKKETVEIVLLEMHARLARLATSNSTDNMNSQPSLPSKEMNQVMKIAVFIAQNYQNPIKASDIGKAVGLHPDYTNAIFKKAFGFTLRDGIIEERISHAKRKLMTSDLSITEIAFDCGFNSISRFNAAFLRVNKCTPREFRREGIKK